LSLNENNNNTTLVFLFRNCSQVLQQFITDQLFLTIWANDYYAKGLSSQAIGSTLVVYMFHKGITSYVQCGY